MATETANAVQEVMTGTMSRAMEIATPLGPDALLFHRMRGHEELGRLSEYRVTLLSRQDIDLDAILGKAVGIKVALADDRVREFNGYVTRLAQHGTRGRYKRYQASVSPWLWFLTRTSDCRVFPEMTVRQILEAVFGAYDDADYDWDLKDDHPTWPYCVQYRETDFDFVSRLLEREGIYYYFQHVDGRARMVLTDSASHHDVFPGCAQLPFVPPDRIGGKHEREQVNTWKVSREIQPGAYAHRDYDPERPQVDLLTRAASTRRHAHSSYERFDYPGGYLQRSLGDRYARLRIDQYDGQFETARAETNARGLAVGYRLSLTRHPRHDQNREYLVIAATYDLQFSDYEAMPDRKEAAYRCRFAALPAQRQFRPRRLTKKPLVHGIQTAVVVGRAGEEIDTDALGRIRVRFHWDRYGKRDEPRSCWVRVSQFSAGHHFGAQFIPRVGQEVVVDFLEGDPDRPIVVGSVYNGAQKLPYDLPAHKTQSGIRTRTTPDGTPAEFNEIRFEDRKDQEELFLQAQRTMTLRVKGSESHSVGGSRSVVVGGGQHTTIAKDHHVEVAEGGYHIAVKQQHMLVDVPNAQFHVCGRNIWNVADEELLSTVHDSSLLMDRTSMFLAGTGEIEAEVRGNVVRIDPTSVSVTAHARITLACGNSKIELTPVGITISSAGPVDVKGLPILLNS